MSRPKKKVDALSIPLEIATGKLSSLEQFNHKLIHLRVKQAINRHPDLMELLEPVLAELKEHGESVGVAKKALGAAKKLVKEL
jgi:hypothetical protein